jgi:putative ABC transport system permease protein
MFEHYESEQDRRQRELRARQPAVEQTGPERRRGWGRRGGWAFWRKNHTVYMPLNTMWVTFRSASGTDNIPDPRLSDIDIKVADIEQMERAALQQARNVLMTTHRGIEDFTFQTQENQIVSINRQIRNTRLSGGIIAAISLLVGGIGIMNIMFASINERIREIGICKAVGATSPAIFLQVLIESIAVSLLGAALRPGRFLRVSSNLLSQISPTQNAPVITPIAMVIAVIFSCGGRRRRRTLSRPESRPPRSDRGLALRVA